ncbi:hypothetical protein EMCRGX_G019570 [Ephydatia muelleri]
MNLDAVLSMDTTALTISIVVIVVIIIGTVYGHYCTHNQYRCDGRNNDYYNDGTWGCINSTLACNGEWDCRFDRSDEQGCGMFPRDDIIAIRNIPRYC